jgi:oxygen-independent coproporphyrinogen-3 oxidase
VSTNLLVESMLIRKYDGGGLRYTFYPPADRFVDTFDAAAYGHWLRNRNIGGFARPLALYLHLPIWGTLRDHRARGRNIGDRAGPANYVEHLRREIRLVAGNLANDRACGQMYWFGGMLPVLDDSELIELMSVLRSEFRFDPAGDYAIEIDPFRIGNARVALLAELGLNRITLDALQPYAGDQGAADPVQNFERTKRVIRTARQHRFKTVGIDLIYGLPQQDAAAFSRTTRLAIACKPDRISLTAHVHRPAMLRALRDIAPGDLPRPEIKLEAFIAAVAQLEAASYVYVGMDQFAKPDDDLTLEQRRGHPTRNLQGYSSNGDCDVVALGVSAISKVGPIYSQNVKVPGVYCDALDRGELPVLRGVELSADDLVRRSVIQALTCRFEVSMESISIGHLIDFKQYFAEEIAALRECGQDGLITLDDDWITVTQGGKLLVPVVCKVFDRYR